MIDKKELHHAGNKSLFSPPRAAQSRPCTAPLPDRTGRRFRGAGHGPARTSAPRYGLTGTDIQGLRLGQQHAPDGTESAMNSRPTRPSAAKKGAESYHQNVLNDAIRRADMEFVQGRDGTQIGGVKMHPKADPDLTIGFGMPGAADRKGRRQQRSDAAGFLQFSSPVPQGRDRHTAAPRPSSCFRLRPEKISQGHPEENGQWPRRW